MLVAAASSPKLAVLPPTNPALRELGRIRRDFPSVQACVATNCRTSDN